MENAGKRPYIIWVDLAPAGSDLTVTMTANQIKEALKNEDKHKGGDSVLCVDCYETDLLKCAACRRRSQHGQGETFPERDQLKDGV